MDKLLGRDEVKELMELIGLNMACWGNLPLIQHKVRLASKKYHPDKGGDPQKMQRLNVLKDKLQATLRDQRSGSPMWHYSSDEVSFWDIELTLGEFLGPEFNRKKVWNYNLCVVQGLRACCCIHCILKRKHKKKAKEYAKDHRGPLSWGKCWCFDCYLDWFGVERSEESFMWWSHIIFQTPMDVLNLWGQLNLL
uniref:Small T antigen n=1 Tax=Human polyomavirus 7 TaxID=746831 RepID=A0A4Y1U1X6_9POLY|nr:small T antigen [Human polyomavirus 7]BBK68914.1 small T antigen [Human polyomavirus 7]BBK68930.1 small T antigen [Human polyomavirus 7]BBK68934.1 small T antigen [Human polyomavirus 7]